ncbi:efflux RND transporter permease subunit [Bradyrhizobium genosp. A]|uniref:efflux RND transporter permease subunit n=1 Tax=Bradyrhizobium genosp. A TaxID=83626 RepID=UPI003CF8BF4E
MIDWIVSYAFQKRLIIWMICVFVAIYGYYSWTQLPLEAYPDIADVSSQVITQAPGLAAEEVERQITIPLERELNGTPGLFVMRSKSTFGLSLITLVFRDGAEDYWSRQRILERVQSVPLPSGITPGLDPLTSPIGEIFRYTLESSSKNLRDLSEIQRWTVIPALKQVPGVADVTNFGGVTTQFQLELDPAQLMRFNVSLKNVTDAINANSANAGGSVLTRGELGYVVRGIGLIENLDDLGNVVVTQRSGTPIFLRDLGKVRLSNQERHGILGKDNRNDTLSGIVLLLRGENPSRVIEGIHAKVAELNKSLSASDVQIVPYMDRSNLVNATIDKVSHTILEGIALVLIVLIVFLGGVISPVIVGMTIPFAMLTAFILMNLTKIPANLLSLGAIDFGIIVDASIVMIEVIRRKREAAPTEPLSEADARHAALQIAHPILFATLIIIAAYLPLFAFQRVEAKLFLPMAYAVGYAQFGALLFALTVVPGLAYVAYRHPRHLFHNAVLDWLEIRYHRALEGLLRRTSIAFGLTALAAAAVVWSGSTVGREFLPELDEGSIWLQVQMPAGISLDKATEMAGGLRKTVREFPEVSYIVTQLGRNDDGTDPWTPSHIEASVGLHPYDRWPNGETKQDLIRRMAERFRMLSGFDVGFSQPMIDGVNDKIAGAHSQLVIKIFGDDFGELRRIAREVVDVLNDTPGAVDVAIDQEPPLPQVAVKIDREATARYAINAADISDLIQKGIGGAAISQVFIGERHYDTTVRFPSTARNSPEAIGDLVLTSSGGALIPLSQVAKVVLQTGESTITREINHRQLTVKLNYRGRDLSSLLASAQQAVEQKVQFDRDKYRIEWGGQFENQRRAETRLLLIFGLVLGLMLVLLYAGFGAFRQALLILGVVPLAILGGLIAIHVTGTTLNVASGVGFIALFGVAVMNAVVMVANLNRVRELGIPLFEAVVTGAGERLRPVLMTAAVATAGMFPAAMATGIGSDVQRGVATVVAGGLILATMLTLFIIPTLYFVIERRVERRAAGVIDPERKL